MTKTKVDLVVDELTFRTFQSEFILETNDAVASFLFVGGQLAKFLPVLIEFADFRPFFVVIQYRICINENCLHVAYSGMSRIIYRTT